MSADPRPKAKRQGFHVDPRQAERTAGLFAEHAWRVRATCEACGHQGGLKAADLARLPPETTIGELVARLKCARCGSADRHADVLQDVGAGQAKTLADYQARGQRST